jgi:hypothetical protein
MTAVYFSSARAGENGDASQHVVRIAPQLSYLFDMYTQEGTNDIKRQYCSSRPLVRFFSLLGMTAHELCRSPSRVR